MAAILHGRTVKIICIRKNILFPWEKESIVPAMQHGCCAKPLYGHFSLSPVQHEIGFY